MPTVVIGAEALRRLPGAFRETLEAAGFRCVDPPGNRPLSASEMLEWLPQGEAILAGGELITAAAIETAKALRVIARVGVGYEAVDTTAASARRIAVTITPGANHDSVAEQAFGLILGVARRIALNDRIVRAGGWDRTLVQPLRGKRLGLVGVGRIGKAMIPRAHAFGLQVAAFDPLLDPAHAKALGIDRLDLDDLLAKSDILSLHLPLSNATRKMIDVGTLAKMKQGAILINTSRGGLIDEQALHSALVAGHLFGAGLDVLDREPPNPDNPLLQLDNVVTSPHIAGIDALALAEMALMAAKGIIALRNGSWPAGSVVNGEIEPGWKW